MHFFSTYNKLVKASFKEATIGGLAPDRGLYFPEHIPRLPAELLSNIAEFSVAEIFYAIMKPYVGEEIPDEELVSIMKDTIDFPIPLKQITENISTLELFHGPTLAFKDVGARFMSRCLGYFAEQDNKRMVVLVATSGDTGGAVADGFFNVPGVDVVILYPSGKVSKVQEMQLTTLGKNIHALEVQGVFDDCQRMVKEAFIDKDINGKLLLSSANSINVARWLPQQVYYMLAFKQWTNAAPPVIAVPSGNFGNICAGLLVAKSGMPVQHFIAACNENDVIPRFFESGLYKPRKTIATISNAMDVGDPSNFARILEMFNHDQTFLAQHLSAYSFTDVETKEAIRAVNDRHQYVMDPHGAVGYLALNKYLDEHPGNAGYFLETAHPVKFHDVMETIVDQELDIPASVKQQMKRIKNTTVISADSNELKAFLLSGKFACQS